jgi:peptide/nickel transport system permease protein
LLPWDAATQDLPNRLQGPTWQHWFGLDELGRDILARVLLGARVSLMVGSVVVGVSSILGMAIGGVSGYYGGWIDQSIGRVMDVLMAFPGMLLAIALVAVLGPSLVNVVLALAVIGWVGYARLVRGQVLRAREFEYVTAAKALGAGTARVLMRHVLPTRCHRCWFKPRSAWPARFCPKRR